MSLFDKKSFIGNNRLEILRKSGIKIARGKSVDDKRTENQDKSIFGGKSEMSRRELREKLKTDDVYNLSRESGLNLNPAERIRIEKELLPKSYGENISKSEFKSNIDKLTKEKLAIEDIRIKEKLKREIEFFKKLGES